MKISYIWLKAVSEKIVGYMLSERKYLITKGLTPDNSAKFSVERLKKSLNTFSDMFAQCWNAFTQRM